MATLGSRRSRDACGVLRAVSLEDKAKDVEAGDGRLIGRSVPVADRLSYESLSSMQARGRGAGVIATEAGQGSPAWLARS